MKDTQPPSIERLRGKALWRELHREKVSCPSCGSIVSRRTLRWKHACAKEVDIETLRSAIDKRAVDVFLSRVDSEGVPTRESDVHGRAVQGPSMPED